MFSDHITFRGFNNTRLRWKVLLQEVFKAALTNKANAR
jgi:hypothetical protein